MKVLTCVEPGQFAFSDATRPVLTEGFTLLRVVRMGICGTDLHAFEGTQPYFTYPRVLGHELCGEVLASDGNFENGELVGIIPYFHCGQCIACRAGKTNCCVSLKVFGVHIDGGMKEVISVPTSSLFRGRQLNPEVLALCEPLAIGAHAVRRGGVQAGENVIVVGAGPIGLGVAEFAQAAGARVWVLDVNDKRIEFCRNLLPSAQVIDGSKETAAEALRAATNGEMASAVFDATGNLQAINDAFQLIAHGGRYVLVGLQKGNITFSHPEFHKREATLMSSRNATRADFDHVVSSILGGKVHPEKYITHRVSFGHLPSVFAGWLHPSAGVVKAIVEF